MSINNPQVAAWYYNQKCNEALIALRSLSQAQSSHSHDHHFSYTHVPTANMGRVSYNHVRGFNSSPHSLHMDVIRNPHVQILDMPL